MEEKGFTNDLPYLLGHLRIGGTAGRPATVEGHPLREGVVGHEVLAGATHLPTRGGGRIPRSAASVPSIASI